MTAATLYRYDVWMHLAGNSATRSWLGTYRRLGNAKVAADRKVGPGVVTYVTDRQTGERLYEGRER